MPLNGLTITNAQWRLLNDAEISAVHSLSPQALMILVYPNSPVLEEKISQEVELWNQLGRPPVDLRIYRETVKGTAPEIIADEDDELVSRYESHGMRPRVRSPNEMNKEGWGEDWLGISEWLTIWGTGMKMRNRNREISISALSPVDNYKNGLRIMSIIIPKSVFDSADGHIYSLDQLLDIYLIGGLFELPVIVTEYNKLAPTFMRDNVPSVVNFYFILNWETPEPDQPNVDLINSVYYQDFINANSKEIAVNKRESWLTDMWERANVRMHDPNCAFFRYAKAVASDEGRAIVPLPSPDGNFENHTDQDWVVAYTDPPLYADRSSWTVREGLPPLA